MTTYQYNDGGREAAGFKGKAGDCVVRAIAIASGRDYATVYNEVNQLSENERGAKRSKANAGVYTSKKAFKDYMAAMGWRFVATMSIGSGCKVHLKAEEQALEFLHRNTITLELGNGGVVIQNF